MEENKIILRNSGDQFAIMNLASVKNYFGEKFSNLKEVENWIPVQSEGSPGISLNNYLNRGDGIDIYLQPVIEGIHVTWCYDAELIKKALEITRILGYDPKIMCIQEEYPLLICPDKYTKDNDGVIVIAPRVHA